MSDVVGQIVVKDGVRQLQMPEYVPAGPIRLAPTKAVDQQLKPTEAGERKGEKPATIPAIVYCPPRRKGS